MGGDLRRLYVGRGAELAVLGREFELAAHGRFRCVVVDGPPGIGKTRLATEFVRRKGTSALGLQARGHAFGAGTAFALWGEAVESYLRGRSAEEVRRVCGGLVDDLAGLVRAAAAVHGSWRSDVPPTRLCEGLATVIANLARQRPVIVVLDDAQLADASSWEALGYLAESLARMPVLVLVAVRLRELPEASAGWRTIVGLEQGGLLTRLEVSLLDEADLHELAVLALGRTPSSGRLVAWLEQQSRGNALFAVTLLDALLRSQNELAEPRLSSTPRPLADWIRLRLGSLDGVDREVAELLSVIGRQTDLAELQSAGYRIQRLEHALTRLVSAGLVTEQRHGSGDRYEISHPVVVDTIYSGMGAVRRRAVHRRVARALAAGGQPDEAALHFVRAATPGDEEAVEAVVAALRHSWSQRTYPEAFRILRALTDVLPARDQRWLDVLDAMPLDHEWAGIYNRLNIDVEAGIQAFREIDRVLVDDGDADSGRIASTRLRLGGFLGWGRGEIEAAAADFSSAVDLFARAGHLHWSLVAQGELSWMHALAGRYQEQAGAAERMLAMAREIGDVGAEMLALGSLGNAHFIRGRFTAAHEVLRHSIETARAAPDPGRLSFGLAVLAGSVGLEGRLTDAQALVDEALESGRGADPLVLTTQARLAFLAGDLAKTRELATRLLTVLGGALMRAIPLTMLSLVAVESGDLPLARRHAQTSGQVLTRRLWMMTDDHELALGLVAWAAGEPAAAVARLRTAATSLLDDEALPYAALLLVEHAGATLDAADATAARWAADRSSEVAQRIDRDHYQALAAITAACAALAEGDADSAVAAATQACAILTDSGYRTMEAKALTLLGRALAVSEPERAVSVLRQAAEIFTECGARWRRDQVLETLADLGKAGRRAAAGLRTPTVLTSREREVARLAAQGLTARQIGEELHIGTRTVESHLAHAYVKLGVNSRVELARVISSDERRDAIR